MGRWAAVPGACKRGQNRVGAALGETVDGGEGGEAASGVQKWLRRRGEVEGKGSSPGRDTGSLNSWKRVAATCTSVKGSKGPGVLGRGSGRIE